MKLSRLMQGWHEMTDDSANALLPIGPEIWQTEQRKVFDWLRTDEQRLLKVVSQGERLALANPSGDMRKTDKDASASERLNLAWEDDQAWRGKHLTRRLEIELAPMPTINTCI